MTLSLPSFLAAATSSLIPPPAEADAALSQPFPLLEPGEEPDEQPVTSNARAAGAASAMSAKRCGDLTGDCLLLTPRPLGARADRRSPQIPPIAQSSACPCHRLSLFRPSYRPTATQPALMAFATGASPGYI